ncbi:hypothetical protein [Winogradskyella psychrotolerans]|uniref:hypothetical protein n=1 Tax=Winogradskyella psychrotolerans TaxID=1344585 RepID=UPI001C07E5AE|nr:hypothetical protein [Winogradskyella psychrotolerans]MBU2926706.1 hypothetical protein [Winogradskyella psychrotolerans]
MKNEKELFRKLGIREGFGSYLDLIKSWSEIIEEIELGYNQNYFELDYDLMVRDEIELLIKDEQYEKSKYYEKLIYEVNILDKRFLTLIEFISDKDINSSFWKRRLILKNAGIEYINSHPYIIK